VYVGTTTLPTPTVGALVLVSLVLSGFSARVRSINRLYLAKGNYESNNSYW
jgi:hypothetical protein